MRRTSLFLVLLLIVSSMSFPTIQLNVKAADATDALIEAFVDGISGMQEKESYVELVETALEMDDPSGLLGAYSNAFNSLTGAQQSTAQALNAVMDQMSGIITDLFDSEFTVDDFSDYIGVSDSSVDRELLIQALTERQGVFASISSSLTVSTIEAGFARLDTIFELMGTMKAFGGGAAFLTVTEDYGDLSKDESALDSAITMLELVIGGSIGDESAVHDAVQELVDYYNGLSSSERTVVYDYFKSNGLVRTVSGTDVGDGTGSGTGGTGGTGTEIPTPPVETEVTEPTIIPEESFEDDIIPAANVLFDDLAGVRWAWVAIRQLYIADVIKGKGEKTFDPDGYITRAEFSALLTRMLETGEAVDVSDLELVFEDVNSNQWFYNEVMKAYDAGYINGVGNGKFSPNDQITREQIAAIISRVLIKKGIEEPSDSVVTGALLQFIDRSAVSSWARTGTAMLADLGIINGVDTDLGKRFNFQNKATRAEVAMILYRVSQIIETKVEVAE